MALAGCPPHDDGAYERVRYFLGMLLGVDDFNQEQEYLLAKARRHNRMLHGWGIVVGLEVSAVASEGTQVSVAPGYALDPCGNEISVDESVLVQVPSDGTSFVVVRFEEVVLGEVRIRDSFAIHSVRDPVEPWVLLAAITAYEDKGLAIDCSVRRQLALG